MNNNKRAVFIVFTVIAFLFLCAGGIGTVIGAMIKDNRLIYLGLTFLGLGFFLYVILFFVLLISVSKKAKKESKNKKNYKEPSITEKNFEIDELDNNKE